VPDSLIIKPAKNGMLLPGASGAESTRVREGPKGR